MREFGEFAERMFLLVTEPALRVSEHAWFKMVEFEQIVKFTLLQFVILVVIYGVTLTPAAMVFPMLIGVLVPLRLLVLPKYFDGLEYLDKVHEEEEKDTTNGYEVSENLEAEMVDMKIDTRSGEAVSPTVLPTEET